ncbi:MAG: hypothetical protein IKK09_08175 [Clostridia bacterium]|nr:hypothetical protein [Clostridia bacterium]
MNVKKVLCIIMCIFFVSLSGCTDKLENVDVSSDAGLSTTQADISEFLNKDYTPSDKLSSDIDSYQVQIYDTVFTFPFYYDELIADGWVLGEYEDPEEEIGSYNEKIIRFQKGYLSAVFNVYNPDVTIHTADACVISGLTAVDVDIYAEREYGPLPVPVFLPGGYQIGVAKMDEVISTYREPDRKFETEYQTTYFEYDTDNAWVSVEISFDENNVLASYDLDKPVIPEDYKASDAVHVENDYKAPAKMGDKITDLTVLFDGDLYTLPAPVSAFIDNGWQIVGDSPTISGRYFDNIELQRGNDIISLSAFNPYETAVTAEDAFVQELSSTDLPLRYKVEKIFEVSGGLNMDMTEDELLNIIKKSGLSYLLPEKNAPAYRIIIDEELNQYVAVRMEDNKVSYISVYTDVREMY